MALQSIARPTIPAAARRDAIPIAHAAIFHLRGDFQKALESLTGVEPELETGDLLKARGYIQTELKDFNAAADSYAAACAKDPDSVDNWFQWGYCLHKVGQLAEALQKFEKAASLGAGWIEIVLARSICHLGLKQYTKAIEKADECLHLDPNYVPALFTKSVALHLQWDLDGAAVLYKRVLELDPKCSQALMNMITAGIQQKRYDLIQYHAEKLLELEPNNPLASEGIAIAAFARGDYETARQCYLRLTEICPNDVEHWLNLGISYRKLGDLRSALIHFTRARGVRVDSIQAHTHLGETLWLLGNLDAARDCYQAAAAKWPDHEELALSLSHVLEQLNDTQAAERVCADFCDRKSDKEHVWFRLGFLQWQHGDIENSVDSFGRALDLRQLWPEAEINLSLACFANGQSDRARDILTSLAEREPGNVEAVKGLAAIAVAGHNDARALELHEKLISLGEITADVYYNCGVLAQNLGQVDEAVSYYRKAIDLRKEFPEALLNLGHALKESGEGDEARSCWIPALELDPELALSYFRHS